MPLYCLLLGIAGIAIIHGLVKTAHPMAKLFHKVCGDSYVQTDILADTAVSGEADCAALCNAHPSCSSFSVGRPSPTHTSWQCRLSSSRPSCDQLTADSAWKHFQQQQQVRCFRIEKYSKICTYVYMYVCMYVYMYVCLQACMYVCVCRYVCLFVCVRV